MDRPQHGSRVLLRPGVPDRWRDGMVLADLGHPLRNGSPRMRPTRRRPRLRLALAALSLLAVTGTAACSTAAQKGDFASTDDGDDSSGAGTSVTLVEQPWVDLQAENEISKQLLTKLGYSVKIDNVSVELGAQALSTGDADA